MTKMRTEWAVKELDKFLELTATYVPHGRGYVGSPTNRGSSADIAAQAHVVEEILDRIPGFGGWRAGRPTPDKLYAWARDQAARGKAALERAEELAQNLGDNAPEMDAAHLHPWAWDSSKAFWSTGHYHQAVMAAAQRVNAETQAKLGLTHPGEATLFQQAFSLNDPQADQPRLRLSADDGSDTFKNLHKGARALGEGLYWAVRNPGMHAPPPADGGSEQIALEQLAAFSLLARWVDQATVER